MNLAQTPDSPLVSLWNLVATAQWVASTGIPLLATVIAVWIAFVIFRRQLVHDRQLARNDLNREWARELTVDLRRCVELHREVPGLSAADPQIAAVDWRYRRQRAMDMYEDLLIRAALRFQDGNPLAVLDRFKYRSSRRWQVAIDEVDKGLGSVSLQALSDAVGTVISVDTSRLTAAAHLLDNWTGEGPLPSLENPLLSGIELAPDPGLLGSTDNVVRSAATQANEAWEEEQRAKVAEAIRYFSVGNGAVWRFS